MTQTTPSRATGQPFVPDGGAGEETVGALLGAATARLRAGGIEEPAREARLLLAHTLGETPASLLLGSQTRRVASGAFESLVERRLRHEPVAHLTGMRGFWTLELAVSPATLVPRADSETVIEALLESRPDRGAVRRILDLGTGTGCLLLAALSEYPQAWGLGVERDRAAAELARANARRNGLDGRSAILCADWGDALAAELPASGRFDVILSNPPYIPRADLAGLMPQVRDWEPALALDGGVDGLDAYRLLLPLATRCLAPGGVVLMEFGIGQAADVSGLARAAGLDVEAIRADLGGIERVIVAAAR